MSDKNQLETPVCLDASLCRLCRFPISREKEEIAACRAIAFHAKCVEMAAPFGIPLPRYPLVTEYSYRHASLCHERRRRRVRELIESALRKTYGKLPPELWHIVSADEELIRLYTIAELSPKRHKTEWSVDLSLPVLITVARMDGAGDHLGIRRITSDPKESSLDALYPAYWETVPANSQTITFLGDGLKLRKLLTPSNYPRVFWPRPVTPSELESMTFYYAGWGEGALEARLRTLTFNEPSTAGYSVCWAKDEMVSIHVHRNTEHGTSRIRPYTIDDHSEFDDRSLLKWTYYPIQEDEFIQEIWLRGSEKYDTTRPLPSQGDGGVKYQMSTPWGLNKYKRPSDIALALVTSKGRKIVAGSFPDHHEQYSSYWKHRHWDLVAKTSVNAPLRVFFSPSDRGIPLIAATRLSDNHTTAPPPSQTPLGTMPRFNPLHTLHYSSASLENITEVLVCKSKNERDTGVIRHFDLENSRLVEAPYKKVAGLLFRYADGSEASVGCFRFDWAETPLARDGSRGLFVGTRPGKIVQIPPHVAAVDIKPPEAEGEFTWMEMPWAGVLEWWFNPDNLDTSITHIL
ncbi:uncharacterized protein FTJAE_11030 [Fusarium tjaetaba]|uniref:Uncharacterized protein n=1 Tax=Fusarium tjaetaba TaxID=1567544 RepID=A0A8H5QWG2_9HYPO|nr:uncharacterized protein FTJAE_11030 [Fusarium tjaetaba]KAF5622169.1 hypothetical protein FTJAE_11030 [Fusarium tjaetaba]